MSTINRFGAAQPAPPLPGNDEHHRQRALGGSGADGAAEELADRRGGGAVDGGGYSLALTRDEYFARFNWLLHETGVLWTKPSEPCFSPALGIPLLMSVPLGAHEERNLETVLRVGAGQRQEDPRAADEWLTDWMNSGLLAINAFQGYFHMPRMGTENIERLLFAPDRSQVATDLGAVLPERF